MNSAPTNLRELFAVAAGAAMKRRKLSKGLAARGFVPLGRGAWLGLKSYEVASGLIITGSPLEAYLSTFVLPTFDRHNFVTWALGRKVVDCSLDVDAQAECEAASDRYLADLGHVRGAGELVKYLDDRNVSGWYPVWVKYLAAAKAADFSAANKMSKEGLRERIHSSKLEQFDEIDTVMMSCDVGGVHDVLSRWTTRSEKILGSEVGFFVR